MSKNGWTGTDSPIGLVMAQFSSWSISSPKDWMFKHYTQIWHHRLVLNWTSEFYCHLVHIDHWLLEGWTWALHAEIKICKDQQKTICKAIDSDRGMSSLHLSDWKPVIDKKEITCQWNWVCFIGKGPLPDQKITKWAYNSPNFSTTKLRRPCCEGEHYSSYSFHNSLEFPPKTKSAPSSSHLAPITAWRWISRFIYRISRPTWRSFERLQCYPVQKWPNIQSLANSIQLHHLQCQEGSRCHKSLHKAL